MAVRSAPTFFNSPFYWTEFDIFFIDCFEYFVYTDYRTFVCVYKGVRIMKDKKEKIIKLMDKLMTDKLTSNQIEYIYHLACKLFGHTPD